MIEKADGSELSEDQLERIAATLERIRAGLEGIELTVSCEPTHIFMPRRQEPN